MGLVGSYQKKRWREKRGIVKFYRSWSVGGDLSLFSLFVLSPSLPPTLILDSLDDA